jgi:hypothetical protein
MSKDTKISFRADDLGKWLSGIFTVERGIITVRSADGRTKTTQVGNGARDERF